MNLFDNIYLNNMKVILILATLLLCSAFGYERLWAKGDVLLNELQNGENDLMVVLFYNSINNQEVYSKIKQNQLVTDQVVTYLKELEASKSDKFSGKVFFSIIDSVDPSNKNIISKTGVPVDHLEDEPVVVALLHGKGFTQYGPTILAVLKDNVTKLLE